MLEFHRRMFRYEEWANHEVVEGLHEARTPPGQAVALLSHIVAAQALWWDRLNGQESGIAVWPAWTLQQCADEAGPIMTRWMETLTQFDDAQLNNGFEYTSSDGRSWSSTVGDTLTHVILHSVYHRAQIASTVRDEGFAPAYTDFIHATRNQHIG